MTARALLLLALAACGGDDDARPGPGPGGQPPEKAPDDPLGGLDNPDEITDPPTPLPPSGEATPVTLDATPPTGGCIGLAAAPFRIWQRPAIAAVTADRDAFVVAGYTPIDVGEEIFVVRIVPGQAPAPLYTGRIDPPVLERIAPPGLVSTPGGVAVAIIDGDGRVRLAESVAPGRLPLAVIATGADRRFSPAVRPFGRRLAVAWTTGGETMGVKLARVAGGRVDGEPHVLTPAGGGAAAPVFGPGGPGALYFIDARAGISPIYRVALDAEGVPASPEVARPVGTVAEPPELAIGAAGELLFAAYTAIGNMATTAVGLVRLDGEGSPQPLVRGTGYGPLNVAAASGPRAVIFAADAPKGEPPEAPREVHVRVATAAGPGAALTLRAPDGTGRHASIARAENGTIAVSFTAGDGIYVALLRCDD